MANTYSSVRKQGPKLATFGLRGTVYKATLDAAKAAINGCKSYADCHMPGVYSIVMARQYNMDWLYRRWYIVEPGAMSPWLMDPGSPLLIHRHAYDFRSTTILGEVRNYMWRIGNADEAGRPGVVDLCEFEHGSGITGSFGLKLRRRTHGIMLPAHSSGPGSSYFLGHWSPHSVTFHPDPITGWFAAEIDELERFDPPGLCWGRADYWHDKTALPWPSEMLYRTMSTMEVMGLMARLGMAIGAVPE